MKENNSMPDGRAPFKVKIVMAVIRDSVMYFVVDTKEYGKLYSILVDRNFVNKE